MVTSDSWSPVYPYTDEIGFTWIDPTGLIVADSSGNCFICARATVRLDIDFEAYYCKSYACNLQISQDLMTYDTPIQ